MNQERDDNFDDKTERREKFEKRKLCPRLRNQIIESQSDMPRQRRAEPYHRERFNYSNYLDDDLED